MSVHAHAAPDTQPSAMEHTTRLITGTQLSSTREGTRVRVGPFFENHGELCDGTFPYFVEYDEAAALGEGLSGTLRL